MTRVHIITEGFVSPNGRAFLYPLVMHGRQLAAAGFDISFSTDREASIPQCDTLMLDSKRFRDSWGEKSGATLALFDEYRKRAGRLIFVDNTDSAGWINGPALSGADIYAKGYVLCDRETYLAPLHGRRAYTDYYHRTAGVNDASPENSPQVTNKTDLAKIRIHWNSGLADYSRHGPMLMALYNRLPLLGLLRRPHGYVEPAAPRDIDVSCRMGTAYARATVAHQRKMIRDKLQSQLRTDKLRRGAFFRELARSRIVVSPFGLGEVTLKDFETFITGGTLLKPDMSHMETWPDFFRAGETILVHRWDLGDLESVIETALAKPQRCIEIARHGQDRYRHHLNSQEGAEEFCKHFNDLVL